MFLYSIVLYSIRLYFHHQTYPQLSIVSYFGQTASFFLELLVIALCSSPVPYWTPPDQGAHLLMSYLFAFSYWTWRSSRQEYWSRLPFPLPVEYILSECFTMTRLSWVALHGMAYSFTELYKPLCMTRLWSVKGIWPKFDHYGYTMEVRNRFKGLDLIDRVPENYEQRFETLYRSQWPNRLKEEEKYRKASDCLRKLYK